MSSFAASLDFTDSRPPTQLADSQDATFSRRKVGPLRVVVLGRDTTYCNSHSETTRMRPDEDDIWSGIRCYSSIGRVKREQADKSANVSSISAVPMTIMRRSLG